MPFLLKDTAKPGCIFVPLSSLATCLFGQGRACTDGQSGFPLPDNAQSVVVTPWGVWKKAIGFGLRRGHKKVLTLLCLRGFFVG